MLFGAPNPTWLFSHLDACLSASSHFDRHRCQTALAHLAGIVRDHLSRLARHRPYFRVGAPSLQQGDHGALGKPVEHQTPLTHDSSMISRLSSAPHDASINVQGRSRVLVRTPTDGRIVPVLLDALLARVLSALARSPNVIDSRMNPVRR
jgi:hypothetical protein